ncbi:MAG: hypothetical protein HYS33_08560 [Acidobacteria bacterium]|nr:hypothetical protein [Acidobacteriota bacterium]
MPTNGIANSESWRAASQAAGKARAERLRLPSGTTILAAKPEPLEWIMSGRIPQRLLAAALSNGDAATRQTGISREEILELARFATQLVRASVIEPAIGDGPGEIGLDEIPIEDRAFIFEWACRSLGQTEANPSADGPRSAGEEVSRPSVDGLERFRPK